MRDNARKIIDEAVEKGAAFLDIKDPDWWKNGTTPNGINLKNLKLQYPNCCILGQRFRSTHPNYGDGFQNAVHLFNLTIEETILYGFDRPSTLLGEIGNDYSDQEIWSYLTESWIDIISERREEDASVD